jgi:hypothetical protein
MVLRCCEWARCAYNDAVFQAETKFRLRLPRGTKFGPDLHLEHDAATFRLVKWFDQEQNYL